jgi:hypothetical protein
VSPPTSAIILVFGVLRQTNFSCSDSQPSTISLLFLFASTRGFARKTEIIAEQIEMSKCLRRLIQQALLASAKTDPR